MYKQIDLEYLSRVERSYRAVKPIKIHSNSIVVTIVCLTIITVASKGKLSTHMLYKIMILPIKPRRCLSEVVEVKDIPFTGS